MFASPWKDALIVLFVVLLFFGPKRLPALSRSIGESIKEFKGGITQVSDSDAKSELASSSNSEAGSVGSTSSAEERPAGVTSEHTNV